MTHPYTVTITVCLPACSHEAGKSLMPLVGGPHCCSATVARPLTLGVEGHGACAPAPLPTVPTAPTRTASATRRTPARRQQSRQEAWSQIESLQGEGYTWGPWWRSAVAGLRAAADSGREFQLYDLVLDGLVEDAGAGQLWGTLASVTRNAGLIKSNGHVQSKRPGHSATAVRSWRGTTGPAILAGRTPRTPVEDGRAN